MTHTIQLIPAAHAYSETESQSHCDWQSVSRSVLVSSPIWGSWPDICLFRESYSPVYGAPSLTRGRVCLYILIKGLIKNSASHPERRPSCHIRHFCNVMWPVAGVQEEPDFGYKIRHSWGFFWATHVHHPLVACCVLSCVDWDPLGDVPYNDSATTEHILTFMQCTYSSSLQKLNFFCIIWSSHSTQSDWLLQY
jgi:hypothetical protein